MVGVAEGADSLSRTPFSPLLYKKEGTTLAHVINLWTPIQTHSLGPRRQVGAPGSFGL